MRIAVFLLAVLVAAPPEELLKVTMAGDAPGTGKAARDEAIRNAEREIVLQVIESVLENPDLSLFKSLLDQARTYIQPSPTLLKYDQNRDAAHVEIEAHVRNGVLRRDIARLVLPSLQPPRKVLALIAEQADADSPLSLTRVANSHRSTTSTPSTEGQFTMAIPGVAEKGLVQALESAGLAVIGAAEARAAYSEAELLQRIQGEPETIGKLARENVADLAIVGTASVTRGAVSAAGVNVVPFTASISVRVVRANDGKLLDSCAVEAVVNSVNAAEGSRQAMEDASVKLRKEIAVPAILAAAGTKPSDDIIITIEKPNDAATADQVLRAVKDVAGVDEAEVLFATENLARIRVKYSGHIVSLVDHITSTKCAGGALEAKRVLNREILLAIASP